MKSLVKEIRDEESTKEAYGSIKISESMPNNFGVRKGEVGEGEDERRGSMIRTVLGCDVPWI